MAFALVNHTIAAGTDSTTIVSSGIDTTGATFAVVITTYLANGTTPVVSDSRSNVWTNGTAYTAGLGTNATIRISWATLTSTNASHTFQSQGVNSYPAIAVLVFSASGTVSLDQATGFAAEGVFSSTVQPGSITPTTNNQLVIFAAMGDTAGATGGSVTSPYTLVDETDFTGFVLFTGSAYAIQTTATATNPTWTFGTSQTVYGAAISSFKEAATFSSEMVQGSAPPRNRSFTAPKTGWVAAGYLTPVTTFSIEMTRGDFRPPQARFGPPARARVGLQFSQTTHVVANVPAMVPTSGMNGRWPTSVKSPRTDHTGIRTYLDVTVAPFSVAEMVTNPRPTAPRVYRPETASPAPFVDAIALADEMLRQYCPSIPELPRFDHNGWGILPDMTGDRLIGIASGVRSQPSRPVLPRLSKDTSLWIDSTVTRVPNPPSTAILDTFNRPNEGPEPTGWVAYTSGYTVTSNLMTPVQEVTGNLDAWVGAGYPFDAAKGIEAYVTLAARPAAGKFYAIGWWHDPAISGYTIFVSTDGVTDSIALFRIDSGSSQPGVSVDVTALPAGSRIGITSYNGLHGAFIDIGSGWQLVAQLSDTTHGTGADVKLVLNTNSLSTRFDDFGGGNPVTYVEFTQGCELPPRRPFVFPRTGATILPDMTAAASSGIDTIVGDQPRRRPIVAPRLVSSPVGVDTIAFAQEMLESWAPLRAVLPRLDHTGYALLLEMTAAALTPDMVQGQRLDRNRQPFTSAKGWRINQTTPVTPFSQEMVAGQKPDAARPPFTAKTGTQTSQPTPINVLSPEMSAGQRPDQPRPAFQAKSGWRSDQTTPVGTFSQEMVQGQHPDAPRTPFAAKPGWVDVQLTPVFVLSAEMTAGAHPDQPRPPFMARVGWTDSQITFITFPPESTFGARPDQPRLPFSSKSGWRDSQPTPVLVLSPEMLAGHHLDQPRSPFTAKAGWVDSQLTPVVVISPEMLAGQHLDQPRSPFVAKLGWQDNQLTPVAVFSPEMAAGHRLDRPRLPFAAQSGWRDNQTTPVGTFSPEMVIGQRLDLGRVALINHGGWRDSQITPVVFISPDMVAGNVPFSPRLPFQAKRGWQEWHTPVAATFSTEMIQGGHPDSPRRPFKGNAGYSDSQVTLVVFPPESTFGYRPDRPRLPFRANDGWATSQPTPVLVLSVEMTAGQHFDRARFPVLGAQGFVLPAPDPIVVVSPEMLAGNAPFVPRRPFRGPEGWATSQQTPVSVFSQEMAAGQHADRARMLFVARMAVIDGQLTFAVFPPESTFGYRPDRPRLPFTGGAGSSISQPTPVVRVTPEMLFGSQPDHIRAPFQAHAGSAMSQLTPVVVVSPEMLQGYQAPQPRLPFHPALDWNLAQPTSVLVLSPEMLQGYHQDRGVQLRAPQGTIILDGTPRFAFDSVLANSYPAAARLFALHNNGLGAFDWNMFVNPVVFDAIIRMAADLSTLLVQPDTGGILVQTDRGTVLVRADGSVIRIPIDSDVEVQ